MHRPGHGGARFPANWAGEQFRRPPGKPRVRPVGVAGGGTGSPPRQRPRCSSSTGWPRSAPARLHAAAAELTEALARLSPRARFASLMGPGGT